MITPELQQAMNNSRGEFNIIVEMAEQFNVEAIKADNMIRSNDAASREIVYDILKAKAEVSQMAVNHLLNVRNVQRFWLVNAFAMTADAEIINKLAAEEAVGKIYLDVEEMMIDPQQSSEETRLVWGVEYIKTQAARDKGITGKGIVVAVVDTGVDLDHSGFAPGQVLVDQSKSFIDNEPTADDGNGHGTHCAGTIGRKAMA